MASFFGTAGDDTIVPTFVSPGVTTVGGATPGDGNDFLDGGNGADTMDGGDGNDDYIVDNEDDVVAEQFDDAMGGYDEVWSSVSYTLGFGIEALYLTGTADNNATGNDLDNHIDGNDGNNVLLGLAGDDILHGQGGNDHLDGGTGADEMDGGTGNDDYYVDNIYDVVSEYYGGGIDDVFATASVTLGYGIENVYLQGTGDINATGNSLSNIMVGNSGDNILDGMGGADDMTGGAGDDCYYVDHWGDSVTEDVGGGNDTVFSSISYTLGSSVENLDLLGYADIDGTGNGLDNKIWGNDGDNDLKGLAGKDKIWGYGGKDNLDGGSGNDKLDGGDDNDNLMGGTGKDKMTGGDGSDAFEFVATNESGSTGATRDQILDFSDDRGVDYIVLSEIDADTTRAGNQAFKLDTGNGFDAGEIRIREVASGTIVELNVDNDNAVEMSILLRGFHGDVTNGDFLF